MAKTVRGKKRQAKSEAVKARKPARVKKMSAQRKTAKAPKPARRKKALVSPRAVAASGLKKPIKFRAASLPKAHEQSAPSAHETAKLFVDCCELPVVYERTGVALMARDPYWIYAYWEINPESLKAIKRKLGPRFNKSVYALRMRNCTKVDGIGIEAKRWFDIDVNPSAQSHYINLERDNGTYRAELGIRAPGGAFYPLARSNIVSTPCANVSDRSEMTWMKVKHERGDPPEIIEQTSALPRVSQSSHGPHEKTPSPDVSNYCAVLSKKFFVQSAIGSSDTLQENPSSSSLSIGASEHPDQQRDFFLEIGTDCIVYGRTKPGARVWLGDDPVMVREDGSFSARFALPEGAVPLHFVAKSDDGLSVRTITTSINRTPTLSD